MDISIADSSCIDAISELEQLCIIDPWSMELIADELSDANKLYLVAYEDGECVGFISTSLVIDTADITNIAVHPDLQRRGIGCALVKECEKQLMERGAKEILLEVRESNAPARNLYEKCGFQVIATRKRYYKHPTEDALIMQKTLNETED